MQKDYSERWLYARKNEVIGIYITHTIEKQKELKTFEEYASNVFNSIVYGVDIIKIQNYEKLP